MTIKTMVESIRECMRQEMEADDSVLVIGEDVGALGGVFRATDGLLEQFGPDRVVDMPLAEGVIVGSGIGLALSGMRPVVEIQFLGFGHQAFHQIGQQAARMHFRSQGRFRVPLVIRAPFGGGVRTPELHSDAFEAFYTHTPGLKVVAPATAYDAKGLLAEAISSDDPVLFLEPLKGYRLTRDEVPDERYGSRSARHELCGNATTSRSSLGRPRWAPRSGPPRNSQRAGSVSKSWTSDLWCRWTPERSLRR